MDLCCAEFVGFCEVVFGFCFAEAFLEKGVFNVGYVLVSFFFVLVFVGFSWGGYFFEGARFCVEIVAAVA